MQKLQATQHQITKNFQTQCFQFYISVISSMLHGYLLLIKKVLYLALKNRTVWNSETWTHQAITVLCVILQHDEYRS